jgi:hypothetical protein
MTLRLLSSGVDSLYLSVNGGVRAALLAELETAKARAQHEGEAVPYEFAGTGWRLLLKPGGHGGYTYWLGSPDVELWVGRHPKMKGPAARVQFHALYLHGMGVEAAVAAVRELLARAVCVEPLMLSVSRIDVYADVQGWRLEPADLGRFVTRANHRDVKTVGRRFTGFVFGRGGGMMARLYDKDAQMAEAGLTWMQAYWRGRVDGEPVWRLEFELRRGLLGRLEVREPEAVLELVPALWQRCTGEWLTLRMPCGQEDGWRWPVDPAWAEAGGLLGEVQAGRELVWRAAEEADEERVLAVLQGSLTSWAAMWGLEDEERAARAMTLRVCRYLARTGRTFASEVRRKRERMGARGVRRAVLGRHARLGPKAREEKALPRIGRSARTARRARVGQSTFLARPAEDTTAADSGMDRTVSTVRVSGGDSPRGWMEAETSGEAVNRRVDGGQDDAGRDETWGRRGTEGEAKRPGEDGRAHDRGHEDDGCGRGDGAGRAKASVGAEPPTQPAGHERNRSRGGWAGPARQRAPGWRGGGGRSGRSKVRRTRAGRRSMSVRSGGARRK